MECQKCGTPNAVGAKYCKKCQAPFPNAMIEKVKICPKCGTENNAKAVYCAKCQHRLRRKSKVPWIVGIAAGLVVIVAGGLVAVPRVAMHIALNRGDTKTIERITHYRSGLLFEKNFLFIPENFPSRYEALISQTEKNYIGNSVYDKKSGTSQYILTSYEDTIFDFDEFDKINANAPNGEIAQLTAEDREKVENIHEIRLIYDEGVEYLENSEYENAELDFLKVVELNQTEDYRYYGMTWARLRDMDQLKRQYLINANQQQSEGSYEDAIATLQAGCAVFGYDTGDLSDADDGVNYEKRYQEGIVAVLENASEYLMGIGSYFSNENSTGVIDENMGAFNLLYAYVLNDSKTFDYISYPQLKGELNQQILEVVEESKESQVQQIADEYHLSNVVTDALNGVADKLAEQYSENRTYVTDHNYLESLCVGDENIEQLIANIPADKTIMVNAFMDKSVMPEEFIGASQSNMDQYDLSKIYFAGIGIYFNTTKEEFSRAVVLIHEAE